MSDNYDPSQAETAPSQQEKNFAMFCHFAAFAGFVIPLGGIIGPLIIWLMKKDESEYVDYHGKESLNFQISMMIAFIVAVLLIFVIIGIPLLIGLVFFQLIMIIIAGIKASEGVNYRYPFCLRLIN